MEIKLWDINEMKVYGEIGLEGPMDHKGILYCYVQEQKCHSKQEWEKLIKPIMEEQCVRDAIYSRKSNDYLLKVDCSF